jgi:hypothetical protein
MKYRYNTVWATSQDSLYTTVMHCKKIKEQLLQIKDDERTKESNLLVMGNSY